MGVITMPLIGANLLDDPTGAILWWVILVRRLALVPQFGEKIFFLGGKAAFCPQAWRLCWMVARFPQNSSNFFLRLTKRAGLWLGTGRFEKPFRRAGQGVWFGFSRVGTLAAARVARIVFCLNP